MHTTRIETAEHGEVLVHHNGDWSGEAIVCWTSRKNRRLEQPEPNVRGLVWVDDGPESHEVRLPAVILLALGEKAAVAELGAAIVRTVEQWKPRR